MRTTLITLATAGALLAGGGPALAKPAPAPGTTAVAVFDAAADTTPQLVGGETTPRGTLVFTQVEDPGNLNDLSVKGRVSGLAPNTAYVAVAYTDAFCTPTPGITAFPSRAFTTDKKGRARVDVLLDPQGLNPAATLDTELVQSVSIRSVVVNANGTTPAVPDVTQTEACDRGIDRN